MTRFQRQSFLGPDQERIFRKSKIGIVGLGGGGSHIVLQTAHLGVGNFVVLDPDNVEESNLNRLLGATFQDAIGGTPKTEVARRLISAVNPKANVITVPTHWQEKAKLLRDCTVVFGCVDKFSERRDIEVFTRRYLIPYIDVGMDVHQRGTEYDLAGQVILSMPGQWCMRCMGVLTDERLAREAELYGTAGGRPQVVWPNGVLGSLAVGVFVQLITPWHRRHRQVEYLEYDGNNQTVKSSNILKVIGGTVCRHYDALDDYGDPFWNLSR